MHARQVVEVLSRDRARAERGSAEGEEGVFSGSKTGCVPCPLWAGTRRWHSYSVWVQTASHHLCCTCLVHHEGQWPGEGLVVEMADPDSEGQGDTATSVPSRKQGWFIQEQLAVELWDEPPKAKVPEAEQCSKVSAGLQTGISAGNNRAVLDLRPCGVTF